MKDIDYSKLQLTEDNNEKFSNWIFSKTIIDVIHTMTGLEVLEEKVNFLSIGEFKQQISGAIVISGQKHMMLSLSMSEYTAKGLVSLITGLKQEDLRDEDFIDGVAELANIVAGKIKAKLNATGEQYETMLPFTIFGDNHHIMHKDKVAALFRLYYTEKIGILARVFYI